MSRVHDQHYPALDPEAINRMSAEYDISADVLSEKLPQIAHGVTVVRDLKSEEPDTDEVRRHIASMRNAAANLKKKLGTVPINSLFHAELFRRYDNMYQLRKDLSDLIAVLDNMDPKGWKQNGEIVGRDAFIALLAKLWKRQTGRPATKSDKPGKFIAFMCQCADLLGFDKEPLPERFSRLKRKYKHTDFEI